MATAGAFAIISAVTAVASTAQGVVAAQARQQQLEEQQRQQQLLADQQTSTRLQQIKTVIETQSVQAAARGISTTSPSFTAIEQNSINNYSTSEKLNNIESNARIAGLQSQIDATQTEEGIGIFKGAVQAGGDAAGFVTTEQELETPFQAPPQAPAAPTQQQQIPSPYQRHVNQTQFGESFGEEDFARIGLFGESE